MAAKVETVYQLMQDNSVDLVALVLEELKGSAAPRAGVFLPVAASFSLYSQCLYHLCHSRLFLAKHAETLPLELYNGTIKAAAGEQLALNRDMSTASVELLLDSIKLMVTSGENSAERTARIEAVSA